MTEDVIYHGKGRRKSAIAQVLLTHQLDEKTINSIPIESYFPIPSDQTTLTKPLVLTSTIDTFGIRAKVQGGGKHAQSQATQLAVARALIKADPAYKKQLKKAGLLTRDSRVKERKKPGLKRARRAPQFSKR